MVHAYDITPAHRSTSRRMTFRHVRRHRSEFDHSIPAPAVRTAHAYNHVGYEYGDYADGDEARDQAQVTNRRYQHGDAIVWNEIRKSLDQLRQSGIADIRVLDAGCGPGTWTRRIADYAGEIGLGIAIVGIDISSTQLEIARATAGARSSTAGPGAVIEFREHDLSRKLPWANGHFDLVLCNYTVLNHLPAHALTMAVGELCRVTSGNVIATLRAIGSQPTGCIIGMEHVREYHHDNDDGELCVTLDDASRHRLPFKMYSAESLKSIFASHADIRELRAIDIFLGRFAADENWTAPMLLALPGRDPVLEQLKKYEEELCRLPGWIDHGTHVLIVAQSRDRSVEPLKQAF